MKLQCDRCQCSLEKTVHTMSMMNQDIICLSCKQEETNHPFYQQAREAEHEQIKKYDYNYPGLYAHLTWSELKQQK